MSETQHRRGYACLKCGGIGTNPSHRTDCPAHDAGNLSITTAVTLARSFLERADRTYVAEAADLGVGGPVRRDLQKGIETVRSLLYVIDQAAIGGLA